MSYIYLKNASELVTVAGHSEKPAKKEKMSDIGIIENGSVLAKDGVIIAVGTDATLQEQYAEEIKQAEVVDATGKIVTPGLVDPHTHIVYAGTRVHEYALRLEGHT